MNPPPPTALAPYHLRLFALIFDYLVVITLLKLLDQVFLGAHWDLRLQAGGIPGLSPAWVAGLVLLMVARDGLAGRSPGKWLTGIAVGRADAPGIAPGPGPLLLRNVTLAILPLDGAFVFGDPFCRRLGDRLAGTVVVVRANGAPLLRRLTATLVLFFALVLAAFLLAPWNMRRSAAFEEAFRVVSASPALSAAVGRPFEVDRSPAFELDLGEAGEAGDAAAGGKAVVTFQVEGPTGQAEATVTLHLREGPRRWELGGVRVNGDALAPLTRKAPPR